MKWMGVAIGSVILGIVLAGLVHMITNLTTDTFVLVAVAGTALMLWTLGRLAHVAGSIEVPLHRAE